MKQSENTSPQAPPILLSAAEMGALERGAIAAGRVTGRALMDRAAMGVMAALLAAHPGLAAPGRALVLCGPGNNGGDGYAVARLLAGRGWRVRVLALAPPGQGAPDARATRAEWAALAPDAAPERPEAGGADDPEGKTALGPEAGTGDAAGAIGPLTAAAVRQAGRVDLVVDALFGTGLQRPLGADLCAALAAVRGDLVAAVDAPSGLCLDSGRVLAAGGALPLPADLTVSFHAAKLGHYLGAGPAACGALAVAGIGLDAPAPAGAVRLAMPDPDALRKSAGGHKYSHGAAAVLSGGVGRGGAARLAARAALRIGAGLVTVGCPPAALIENAARLDAVMLRAVADGPALAGWLAQEGRLRALCLGPGLGLGGRAAGLLAAALRDGRPLVLDADALTLLAQDGGLRARLHADCVLTPHGGEFARLWPDLAARLAAPAERGPAFSRLDAARAAAAEAGAVVVLKGPDTVIAAPDGTARVHAAAYGRAAPWLATAGAGDVLAGLIAGLLARGQAPLPAAATAAWLHAEAALAVGPGLIAEDLPEALPGVLRRLGV